MLLNNSLTYITVWLLFQLSGLSVKINCQMAPFNPKQRLLHTATFIDNKLYILGGAYLTNISININEFFYLDFSGPFNTKELSWKNLSDNTIPPHGAAATAVGGENNNTLFLYGGNTLSNTTMSLFYTFDTQSKIWRIPNIAGANNTIRKQGMTGVIDGSGKIYLWGGVYINRTNANDMFILDTINLSLGEANLYNAPVPKYNYGAVLLPDQNIIYMGGYNSPGNIELTLQEVYIYHTADDYWGKKITSGGPVSNRDGFSAVLGLDGQRVIIFGGTASTNNTPLAPGDTLYVLKLHDYEWSIPKFSGVIPSSRMYHKANIIGKYMVISFGLGYDQTVDSDILLLDISNNDEYIWTNNFVPTISNSTTSQPSNNTQQPDNSSNNKPAIISTIIGSLLGSVLLISGGLFLYKRNNRNKQIQQNPMSIDYFD